MQTAQYYFPQLRAERSTQPPVLLSYGLTIGLLVITALLGHAGLAASRFFFIAGCAGVSWMAFRQGGFALHVQVAILLFVFAPLVRRIVDLSVGYDASGSMLVGPLVGLIVTFPELAKLLSPERSSLEKLFPHLIALCCLAYGWSISAFQGEVIQSSAMAAKYVVPLLYCVCLMLRPDESTLVLEGAARAFLAVSPIIGLYGIYQHLNPQPWDRLWMIESKMDSIGTPEPGKVRVFGTMNSPVSFAAYATCGLLLFTFARRTFIPKLLVPFLVILPISLALLLSAVRTAWISAMISTVVCLCFRQTRGRATILVISLGFGIAAALLLTSFGDVVSARLSSLNNSASSDGSGNARLDDYSHVFGGDSRYLLGVGFASRADREMNALDGLLLSSAVQMGTVFGVLQAFAVLWAGVQAVLTVHRNSDTMRLVGCALVIGNLAIFLLTSISIGELGFLYWMLVGVLTCSPAADPTTDPASG